MRRIQYIKTTQAHILKSYKNIRSQKTGAQYSVELDTKEMLFKIRNVGNRTIVSEGGDKITNLHVLKTAAKKALENLGCEFELETRDNSGRVVGENCGYGAKKEPETEEKSIKS